MKVPTDKETWNDIRRVIELCRKDVCGDHLLLSTPDGETTITLMCSLKPNHEGPHTCGQTTWTHTFEPGTRSGT